MRRIDGIGIVLTLAAGGVAVELLADSATVILSVPRADIDAALRGLKLFPLLDRYRGHPRACLARAVIADAVLTLKG